MKNININLKIDIDIINDNDNNKHIFNKNIRVFTEDFDIYNIKKGTKRKCMG